MKVYVLSAINLTDFEEPNFVVVGTTIENADKALHDILKLRWERFSTEDRKFYDTFNAYVESWIFKYNRCKIEVTDNMTNKPMSNKSPEVVNAIESVFPDTKQAINECKCPICKKPIGKFKDELSKREYHISGLCQECQDSIFGG